MTENLACPHGDFVGKNPQSLRMHMRRKGHESLPAYTPEEIASMNRVDRIAAANREAEALKAATLAGEPAPATPILDFLEAGKHKAPAAKAPKAAKPKVASGPRLTPGGLPPLILGHMATSPSAVWTPSGIAAALGRSAGAVANALARLAVEGQVTQTSAKPRQYQLGGKAKATVAAAAKSTRGRATAKV